MDQRLHQSSVIIKAWNISVYVKEASGRQSCLFTAMGTREKRARISGTRDRCLYKGREFHNGTNAANNRSVLQEGWRWILY